MPQRRLISFDWAMKKLLRSKANFEILEGFLSELLKDDIRVLQILESESNKESFRDKYNRVDLKVKNHKGEIIIIEVQYEREFDYLHRIIFGTSKAVTEHLQESDSYEKIAKIISVNILYFDLGQGTDYVYHGLTSFTGIHDNDLLELSEEQQELYQKNKIYEIFPEYYLIKVNKFNDIAKDTLDEWVYFLKNEEIKDDFKAKGLKKAKQALDILKLSDEERQAYAGYQEDLHLQASMVQTTYNVGVMKGKKEGREEGRREQGLESAKKLLSTGQLDIQTIANVTGLTVDDIKALKS